MFKSKTWCIPLVSIFTGIIISSISSFIAYIMARNTNEWTASMGNYLFLTEMILAIILFFITGLFFLRDMSKKDIMKSAAIVVTYYIVIICIEQILIHIGQYPFSLIFSFVPVGLYSVIHQLFLRFTELPLWIGLIPSIVSPFLYVVFGKDQLET